MAVRQSSNGLSTSDIQALRRAYSETMTLRDERGYHYFAGMHGLPLPVFCQHGNLLFLPWHRAYLYFFELALQDRVPGVAIPWWDWISDEAHAQGVPPIFSDRAVSGQPNPFFDAEFDWDRDLVARVRQEPGLRGTMTGGTRPRTRRDQDVPDELPRKQTIDDILQAPTFEDFSSRLETPHGMVHVWVGGSMSQVPTAAYDPIFWSHHSMVDRLWYLWQMNHRSISLPLSLLNEALPPFSVTVGQMLDISRLGYDYAVQVT